MSESGITGVATWHDGALRHPMTDQFDKFAARAAPAIFVLQWLGLLLGLGGVVLILHDRPLIGQAGWGWFASAVSLVSITLGTLYQRRYCSRIDWQAGNLVQYLAVTVFFAAGAFLFETRGV